MGTGDETAGLARASRTLKTIDTEICSLMIVRDETCCVSDWFGSK